MLIKNDVFLEEAKKSRVPPCIILSSLSLLVRSQEANGLVLHLVQDYQSNCVYLLGEIVGVWALYELYE
jgi:hypothetical protein